MSNVDIILEKIEEQLDEGLLQMVDEKVRNIWLNFVNHRKDIINALYKYFPKEMEVLKTADEIKDFLMYNQEYIRKHINPNFVIKKG